MALLRFNKLDVLLCVIMMVLGIYFGRPRRKVLLWGGATCVAAYILLMPLVSAGRFYIEEQSNRGVSNRLVFLYSYLTGSESVTPYLDHSDTMVQYGWSRLNYSNTESFAMDAYDQGEAGKSFQMAVYTFVPRIVWRDKPVIDFGTDFNELMFGNKESSTGIGILAEAYWNGGWLMVAAVSTFVGLEFAWFTIMSIRYMPCAFFGLYMGLRPDDWFVTVFVGQLVICIAYFTIICTLVPPPHYPSERAAIVHAAKSVHDNSATAEMSRI